MKCARFNYPVCPRSYDSSPDLFRAGLLSEKVLALVDRDEGIGRKEPNKENTKIEVLSVWGSNKEIITFTYEII